MSSSLMSHNPNITLFIVCMDKEVEHELTLNPIPSSKIYSHEKLQEFRPELKKLKKKRTKAEYFFTCSAQVCDFIIQKNKEIDILNYIDADLYFFNSVESIYSELGKASIGIIEHKFHWLSKQKIKYGRFNVGWITFRNDNQGRKCISGWAKDCMDWCYQRLERGLYADQKYLDYWPSKYSNIKILENPGLNLAIWNVKNYKLKTINNRIYVNESPLIFYHFAGLKQLDRLKFTTQLSSYYTYLGDVLLNNIYLPYLNHIFEKQTTFNIGNNKEMNRSDFSLFVKNFLLKVRTYLFNDLIQL